MGRPIGVIIHEGELCSVAAACKGSRLSVRFDLKATCIMMELKAAGPAF